jgi:phage terminase large subunit-like protein
MSAFDRFMAIAAELSAGERERLYAEMVHEEKLAVDHDFASFAHEGQRAPSGDWHTWVVKAGRGFGKTRAGAEWLAREIEDNAGLSIALIGATIDEARKIMVEGRSGILSVAPHLIADWSPTLKLVRFERGSEARLFSGARPAQLRGPEHHLAWCDELAKWEKAQETWDMLQLGLRLGDRPRVLVTTTPQPGPVLTRIMDMPGCVVTGGRTYANPHISRAFVDNVRTLYEGTRLGRQEIDGELLPAAGALWTVELIARCRVRSFLPSPSGERDSVRSTQGEGADGESVQADDTGPLPSAAARLPPSPQREREGFSRTLIAVDPPSGDGTCGIVACAREGSGATSILHVLADHSVTGRSPEGWAHAVAGAAAAHGTREVIAESNQGGRMVKSVLLAADEGLNVHLVTAAHGKAERAEPVAHLFEAGRVRLHGRMPELEAQLLGMIAGGDYEGPGRSPDRADAMVWGVSMLAKGERVVRVRVV